MADNNIIINLSESEPNKNGNYNPDDIRKDDPNLYYRGKDGREYYNTQDLEDANNIY